MGDQVGEAHVNGLARRQLDDARHDPRLDRPDDRAVVADFWAAIEEAERSRNLSLWGLHELQQSLEREEQRLGALRDDDLETHTALHLQAAYERSELAKAELANGFCALNAQALISMNSALDAMIESLLRYWRDFIVDSVVDHVMARTQEKAVIDDIHLTEEQLSAVRQLTRERIQEESRTRLPKPARLNGSGSLRYERLLQQMGWGAPVDRPIPKDLDVALTELGALRDVLVHRAGRVDGRALEQAPTLPYRAGELIRITRDKYREYSAAVCCYAEEVWFRAIRTWPEVTDAKGPNLALWREHAQILS